MAKKSESTQSVDIIEVEQGAVVACIVGTSPLIMNRMSEKAKHSLLSPSPKKTAVEKAVTAKHDPLEEYRASVYRQNDPAQPCLLSMLSTAFKGSMMTAALDLPGAKKAVVGRLTYVHGTYVGVYGVPQMLMAVVRMADMAKTPDIRTRAILPRWACQITVNHVKPMVQSQAVANLLAAAGVCVGIGDWRTEKGRGNFGMFRLAKPDDPEYLDIVKTGGRAAQAAALEAPTYYDEETAELITWYDADQAKRRIRGVA